MRTKIVSVLIFILLFNSCSVKEDRTPCPCWLRIFLSDSGRYCHELVVGAWSAANIFSEKIAVEDYTDYYEHIVPKGVVQTAAYAGIRRGKVEGGVYTVSPGEDADSLYSHQAIVECCDEFAMDTIRFHKQFARVFIKVELEEGDIYPYLFIVRSDVCGMNLKDGSPSYGAFETAFTLDEHGEAVFALPRQDCNSDELQICMYRDGQLKKTIPLATHIRSMGYSWAAKDLKDIYLGIDYGEAFVSVSIQGWGDGKVFDIEI